MKWRAYLNATWPKGIDMVQVAETETENEARQILVTRISERHPNTDFKQYNECQYLDTALTTTIVMGLIEQVLNRKEQLIKDIAYYRRELEKCEIELAALTTEDSV